MAALNITGPELGIQTRWSLHDGRSDIRAGINASHVWLALGWHDIRQRYRRSILGPFWFTLSTLIMVGVLGFLYSSLLHQEIKNYLPFLGVGLVVWQYIAACINEGANTFIGASYLIKQIRMPLTIHVCRAVWRNFAILLHSLPVVMVITFGFGHLPSERLLWLVPALAVLLFQGIWIGVVLGTLCARYRDVVPIVGNLLQIAFFFTPVMWSPELLKDRNWVVEFNPLYHLVEIIRAPILNQEIAPASWLWSIALLLIGYSFAQFLMVRCRDRVPYWL